MKDQPSPTAAPLPTVLEAETYIGQTLGDRYQILAKLREGSQGRVFVGRHLLIDRPVAIKCLWRSLANDSEFVARFLNEGRAAGALGHPNIAECLDLGLAPDGSPYLVMELLDGPTLAEQIDADGAFSVGRAAYIASQAASGLAAAHARGIVHRDLKPDNLLLIHRGGRPDQVKILDFGVSKFRGSGSRVKTLGGHPLGTPGFMAPEQIERPQDADHRADVYGLGATLYNMLTGSPPFAGIPFPKVLSSIAEGNVTSLGALRPDLPKGMVALVERAMSREPAARFHDMNELEEALGEFAREPPRGRSVAPGFSLTSSLPPASIPPATPSGSPRPSPRPASPAEWRAPDSGTAAASAMILTGNRGPAAAGSEATAPLTESGPPTKRRRGWLLFALAFVGLGGAFGAVIWLRSGASERSVVPPTERRDDASIAPTREIQRPASSAAKAPDSDSSAAVARPATPPPTVSTPPATTASASTPPSPTGAGAVRPRPRPATPSGAERGAKSASDATNCATPFFFDGKKKVFKPECL
jgi:eukaryotic-like serine/threonine-protein kinase